MWKVFGCFALVSLVICQEVANPAPNITIATNSTSNTTTTAIKAEEVKKVAESVVTVKIDVDSDAGSIANPFQPSSLVHGPGDSIGNVKYYFAILVVSSLSVISIIVFKALRLRKSRAELKYGMGSASDRSEVEPLGRNKWLEESSDENEDEIFDINFLKNSRTNKV